MRSCRQYRCTAVHSIVQQYSSMYVGVYGHSGTLDALQEAAQIHVPSEWQAHVTEIPRMLFLGCTAQDTHCDLRPGMQHPLHTRQHKTAPMASQAFSMCATSHIHWPSSRRATQHITQNHTTISHTSYLYCPSPRFSGDPGVTYCPNPTTPTAVLLAGTATATSSSGAASAIWLEKASRSTT